MKKQYKVKYRIEYMIEAWVDAENQDEANDLALEGHFKNEETTMLDIELFEAEEIVD